MDPFCEARSPNSEAHQTDLCVNYLLQQCKATGERNRDIKIMIFVNKIHTSCLPPELRVILPHLLSPRFFFHFRKTISFVAAPSKADVFLFFFSAYSRNCKT